ncbi:uncharacterized protein LOC124289621, partial [Haliotis rubra]|uniref:uncharacterized protein LOC124289621 n=1 Tax=Haliotis rubra TaxID=36100 RepID=UPI001EE59B1D
MSPMSNEVKNSHHMELEGLKRGLSFLEQKGCAIKEVITDRHVSVKKYIREEHKDKKHYFDVWHGTKVGKKLEAAAPKSGCAAIRPWIKSTTNHINFVFTGSKPYKAFMEVVSSGYLVRDLPNQSPVYQTKALEVFHSVINHSAPKNTHCFYAAMVMEAVMLGLHFVEVCSITIAMTYIFSVIKQNLTISKCSSHFNENGNHEQATDHEGNSRWKMMYPKSKKGEDAVVKPDKQPVSFSYAEDLQRAVIERRRALPNYPSAKKDADKHFQIKPLPLTKSFKLGVSRYTNLTI